MTQANEEIMIERARVETLKEELQAMKLQEIGSRKYEQGIFQELQHKALAAENQALKHQNDTEAAAQLQVSELQRRLILTEESNTVLNQQLERRVSALSLDSQSEMTRYQQNVEQQKLEMKFNRN